MEQNNNQEQTSVHQLKREELLEVLRQDGTLEQLEEYVKAKEWTEEEKDLVIDFLSTEEKARADAIYRQILDGIMERPVYENAFEAKNDWGQFRKEIADEIKSIKDLELASNEKIKQLEKELEDLEEIVNNIADPEYKKTVEASLADISEKTHARLETEHKNLSVLSNRHNALALMHEHARSEERQAVSRVFLDSTAEFRQSLKNSWENLYERGSRAVNMTIAISQSQDLTFGQSIPNAINKWNVNEAKTAIKSVNFIEAQIRKREDKMIARANAVVQKQVDRENAAAQKEFRKDQFLNKLESITKGVKMEPAQAPELIVAEKITDVNRAKEVLGEAHNLKTFATRVDQWSVNNMTNMRDFFQNRAERSMEHVAEVLRTRREKAIDFAERTAEKIQEGKLGYSEFGMKQIEKGIEEALNASYMDPSFDNDLSDWMKKNGYEDLIKGYEAPAQEIDEIDEMEEEIDIDEFDMDNTEAVNNSHDEQGMDEQEMDIPDFGDSSIDPADLDEPEIEEQDFDRNL